MITYSIAPDELRARIEAHRPGWLARAARRTRNFLEAGAYDEENGIWSEVKSVFMALQHDKCAFCERQLAAPDHGGSVEHDLEHFRPKKDVRAWPDEPHTGDDLAAGYYWLAYDPLNYAASCKKCNTSLKGNYFPIAGERGSPPAGPCELAATELPLLAFPLGDWDEPVEQLVTFRGIVACPAASPDDPWRHRRGAITIRFFRLNEREELRRERAECLVQFDDALRLIETGTTQYRADAEQTILRLRHPASRHSRCVAAAAELYTHDVQQARTLLDEARAYLDSLYG